MNKLGGKLVKKWTTLVNLMEFLKNIGLKDFLKMVATIVEFEIAENLTEEINDKKISSLESVHAARYKLFGKNPRKVQIPHQSEECCNFVLGKLFISYQYG